MKKFLPLLLTMLFCGSAWAGAAMTSITPNSVARNTGPTAIVIRGSGFTFAANSVVFQFPVPVTVSPAGGSTAIRLNVTLTAANVNQAPGLYGVTVDGVLFANTFRITNNTLQVNARATISSIIDISWGAGNSNDSAGTAFAAGSVANYSWVIGSTSSADAATSRASLGGTYTMSDDYNLFIRNASRTMTTVRIFGSVTAMGTWTVVPGVPAADQIRMQGRIAAAAPVVMDSTVLGPQIGSIAANATFNNDARLDLIFTAPTSISAGADVQQTAVVTLTGTL